MIIQEFIIGNINSVYPIIQQWGYLGVFIISIITSASFFFIPFPMAPLVFILGGMLNPLILAIIVAVGSTIGSSVKYLIGLGGKEILEKKYSKELRRIRNAFEKYNFFMWIIAVTLTPFPDDPVIIFCGIVKYDFKKYFFAMLIGRLIMNFILAYAGYYSIDTILKILGINF